MGFFKKHGKPRQYRIISRPSTFSGSMLYELEYWNRCFSFWAFLNLYGHYQDNALERLRQEAALDARVKGYGDNYEITELI